MKKIPWGPAQAQHHLCQRLKVIAGLSPHLPLHGRQPAPQTHLQESRCENYATIHFQSSGHKTKRIFDLINMLTSFTWMVCRFLHFHCRPSSPQSSQSSFSSSNSELDSCPIYCFICFVEFCWSLLAMTLCCAQNMSVGEREWGLAVFRGAYSQVMSYNSVNSCVCNVLPFLTNSSRVNSKSVPKVFINCHLRKQ